VTRRSLAKIAENAKEEQEKWDGWIDHPISSQPLTLLFNLRVVGERSAFLR
jgi:hypothetical protein